MVLLDATRVRFAQAQAVLDQELRGQEHDETAHDVR
jgi:hypothetical protein